MFIRTERLLLRPGFVEDAPELAMAIGDEAIVRNLSTAPWPYGEQQALAFLAIPPHPIYPSFLVLMRTHAAPRIVGGVGLAPICDGSGIEIGYWVARSHWGLGIATEAARATMAVARALRLSGLKASHFTDNPASGRVLRKIGFRPTGIVTQRFSMARGRAVPCALFEQAGNDGAEVDLDMSDPTLARCTIYPDSRTQCQMAA